MSGLSSERTTWLPSARIGNSQMSPWPRRGAQANQTPSREKASSRDSWTTLRTPGCRPANSSLKPTLTACFFARTIRPRPVLSMQSHRSHINRHGSEEASHGPRGKRRLRPKPRPRWPRSLTLPRQTSISIPKRLRFAQRPACRELLQHRLRLNQIRRGQEKRPEPHGVQRALHGRAGADQNKWRFSR